MALTREQEALKEILGITACTDGFPHTFEFWNEFLFKQGKVAYKCINCSLVWPGGGFDYLLERTEDDSPKTQL